MAFLWDAKQFNLQEYEAYLHTLADPSWVKGITLHHTWKPTQSQWLGMRSMAALARYYQYQVVNPDGSKGWPAGPQLFLCLGAPNPADDGIFQGTPVNRPGVHAGACNKDHIGIEVVGDFDHAKYSTALSELVTSVIASTCRWAGLAATQVIGHRDCGSPKTCPGSAIIMSDVQKLVLAKLDDGIWDLWGTAYPLPPEQRGFGIPQAWVTKAIQLGPAISWPTYYADEEAVQLFKGGLVVYRAGSGRVHLYTEL